MADWGPLPGPRELASAPRRRWTRASAGARAPVPATEVDEMRIVWGWMAEHEPPALALDPPPDADWSFRRVSGRVAA